MHTLASALAVCSRNALYKSTFYLLYLLTGSENQEQPREKTTKQNKNKQSSDKYAKHSKPKIKHSKCPHIANLIHNKVLTGSYFMEGSAAAPPRKKRLIPRRASKNDLGVNLTLTP